MIELFEQDERKNDRQSSKGNQLKWENRGIWKRSSINRLFIRGEKPKYFNQPFYSCSDCGLVL